MIAVRQTSTTGTSSETIAFNGQAWEPARPCERYAADMFDVLVTGNKIRLEPRNAVAAALLNSFLAATVAMRGEYRATDGSVGLEYGAGMVAGELTFTHRPLLTKGGDPHFTGHVLSMDEVAVAMAAVAEHRVKKAALTAKGTAKNTKAAPKRAAKARKR